MMQYLFSSKTETGYKYVKVTVTKKGLTFFSHLKNYYIPSINVSLDKLTTFLVTEELELLLNPVLLQGNTYYLKPLAYKLIEDKERAISSYEANNYTIYLQENNYVVNYDNGKFKIFTSLSEAIDWINEVHYVSKQIELLGSLIYLKGN